ncbi:hypothetical protein IBT47_17485 [Erwinia sp. S43]|uniref:DUF6640 family protein n=1 Tax=unclassified Erwinia TaxID=2622719 RepID=UPI00190C7D82|nr:MULTISPECIES: DUF6640 family protein [unclassified Erwinia]MBJ9999701.1 hypothetical protein [Erwinia sp. S38]MBK0034086.1 hypothetical protein [Erwinia sp. S43]
MNTLTLQVLLTICTLGYSVIPSIFDSNETHMTNPKWVPHARFHVVWQVCSYIGFALVALWAIWGADFEGHLWLAAAMSASAYGGFFTAVFARRGYGGGTYDSNGVLPWRPPVLGRWFEFEVNITLFSSTVIILAMAVIGLLIPQDTVATPFTTLLWSVMYVLFALLMFTVVIFVGAFVVGRRHQLKPSKG